MSTLIPARIQGGAHLPSKTLRQQRDCAIILHVRVTFYASTVKKYPKYALESILQWGRRSTSATAMHRRPTDHSMAIRQTGTTLTRLWSGSGSKQAVTMAHRWALVSMEDSIASRSSATSVCAGRSAAPPDDHGDL